MAEHAHAHAGGDHDAEEHHAPPGLAKYVYVFLGLLALTAISFTVARSPLMQTPAIGWALMMAVSVGKALLVIAFFMHLKWEANWKYVLTIPASIMCVFLVLMLTPDIGARTRHYSEERWSQAAQPRTDDHAAHGAAAHADDADTEHGDEGHD